MYLPHQGTCHPEPRSIAEDEPAYTDTSNFHFQDRNRGQKVSSAHLLNGSTFLMDPQQHHNCSSACPEDLQLIAEIRKFRSRLSLALMESLGTGLASACWTHRELRYWCSMKQIKCSRYLVLPQDWLYCYLSSGAPKQLHASIMCTDACPDWVGPCI